MTLIRTFHPFGQGAFYTESHILMEPNLPLYIIVVPQLLKDKSLRKNQTLILKTIQNNQAIIAKIENRVYRANLESASAAGAIKTLIQMVNQKQQFHTKRE